MLNYTVTLLYSIKSERPSEVSDGKSVLIRKSPEKSLCWTRSFPPWINTKTPAYKRSERVRDPVSHENAIIQHSFSQRNTRLVRYRDDINNSNRSRCPWTTFDVTNPQIFLALLTIRVARRICIVFNFCFLNTLNKYVLIV